MDLLSVLPDFNTKSYAHILPPLERSYITTVDLITLDTLEIAKRAHVPPADVRRLSTQIIKALHRDIGFEERDGPNTIEPPSSSIDAEVPVIPGPSAKLDLSQWSAISTLDPALDALLGGGVPTGYVTEVTGESGSGKTQFLLSLLLAVQLPKSQGLGKKAIYISTEAPLSTTRLSQLIEFHPCLSTLPQDSAPSLDNILSINAMDLETQDHILNFQLPVAIARYDVGLVVIDSITSNYRAEHTSHGVLGLSTRSGELVKLGQLLRNLAVKENIAIVVANQVSDRFDPIDSHSRLLRTANGFSSSPLSTQQQQQQQQHRDPSAASPLPLSRSRLSELGKVELSQAPPSSSPFPSSPYVAEDEHQQPFDGSYLVGNPVHNELLSLMHQQRFFTGWGDTPNFYPSFQKPTHKTPALGFVWSTQIACRIALKKKEEGHTVLETVPEIKQAGQSQPPKDNQNGNQPPNDNDNNHASCEVHPNNTPQTTETTSSTTNATPSIQIPPSSAEKTPERGLRRTMKLVFAPWTAGSATTEGQVQDEVDFTIWKGGLRSSLQ